MIDMLHTYKMPPQALREAVHSLSYFSENVAICVHFVAKSVFLDDILWEEVYFHPEVFKTGHGGHQVEVFDVNCHELRIGCQDDTVEHEFDSE